MNRLTLFFTLALFSSVAGAEPSVPQGSKGEVTLDWKQFNELWTQLQTLKTKVKDFEKPDATPPVPFALSRAIYQGKMGAHQVTVDALFEIEVYEPKRWVRVPLLPDTVAVAEARLDGKRVALTEDGGLHTLVLKSPGAHVLSLKLSFKAPGPDQTPEWTFVLPRTPMTSVAMHFPLPNLDITAEPAAGAEIRTVGGETIFTATLAPSDHLTFRWHKTMPEDETLPAKLFVETETLATLTDSSAHLHETLHYEILRRKIDEVRAAVPEGWNLLTVAAEGLEEWKVLPTVEGATLVAHFSSKRKGSLALSLELEKSVAEADATLAIPRIRTLGTEREQGTLGVAVKGSLEVDVAEKTALDPMDPQELPPTAWQSAGGPVLFAFRYTRPFTVALGLKHHTEIPMLTTTIDLATAETLVTDRGQAVTRLTYQVRNHLKQYLTLHLPEGARIWSAFVNGEPIKPTSVSGRDYRIPLTQSSSVNGAFPVDVVLYNDHAGAKAGMYRSLRLPSVDAPISQLSWNLNLPQALRVLHFGGNVEPANEVLFPAARSGLSMDKDFVRAKAMRPFQAMGKNMQAVLEDAQKSRGLSNEGREEKDEDLLVSPALSEGVLPIRFEVPSEGRRFQFQQVMLVDASPEITLLSLRVSVMRAAVLLLLGGMGFLIIRVKPWTWDVVRNLR